MKLIMFQEQDKTDNSLKNDMIGFTNQNMLMLHHDQCQRRLL